MYPRFSLVLSVNHACNMRCSYCYAGRKFSAPMPEQTGRKAIDRAIASTQPGGSLSLGFFGGEPLLEAGLIAKLIDCAYARAEAAEIDLSLSMTVNGTVTTDAAWALMTRPGLSLAVSCHGLPEVHDRYRRFPDGTGSARVVLNTIARLQDAGRDFRVVMVVRPDTVAALPEGIQFLREQGVTHVDPSLDLWTHWSKDDVGRLETTIESLAQIWRDGLPKCGINWFDEKAVRIAQIPATPTARCGFGSGEIAVAPSGNLYPCERLIGSDDELNPMRLPGSLYGDGDFICRKPPKPCHSAACDECQIQSLCNTTCRCSNYARTGKCGEPDALLCALNRACAKETVQILSELQSSQVHNAPGA